MIMNQEDIRKIYSEIKEQNELLLETNKKKQFLISLLRLLVFVGGGILSVIAFGLLNNRRYHGNSCYPLLLPSSGKKIW